MSKTLFLMRHAEAASATNQRDFDRPLTLVGEAMAQNVGAHLTGKNLLPQKIICSTALRARQTAQFMCAAFPAMPQLVFDEHLYGGAPEDVLSMLQMQDETERLMLLGHNPWVHMLALTLCKADSLTKAAQMKNMYPPSSCAILEFEAMSWMEITKASGMLVDFYYAIGDRHG